MEENTYSPSNREKVRQPRPNKPHYCGGCDAALVHQGKKCPYCERRDKGRLRAPKRDSL